MVKTPATITHYSKNRQAEIKTPGVLAGFAAERVERWQTAAAGGMRAGRQKVSKLPSSSTKYRAGPGMPHLGRCQLAALVGQCAAYEPSQPCPGSAGLLMGWGKAARFRGPRVRVRAAVYHMYIYTYMYIRTLVTYNHT